MNGSWHDKLRDMQTIFKGNGPVFETANFAFSVLFEGAGVSKILSRTRHLLMDEYECSPEDAAAIVNMVRNLVYDPMAAHGIKPEADQTVKKYMDKFQLIAEYVANTIIGYLGINDKAKQRIAYLGEEIRKFLSNHPDADINNDLLHRLDRSGASHCSTSHVPAVSEKGGDYVAIPIDSSGKLKSVLSKLGADDVKWCIRDLDYWTDYSNNGRNSFYILYNSKLPATDPMSIIGTFVTPFNRVAYSFDRPNHSVNFDKTEELLANSGISLTRFDDNEMLAALNENMYDLEEIFPDYETLKSNVYLVKSEDGTQGAIVVDDNGHFRSLTNGWVDLRNIGTISEYVTDGKSVYSLYEPFEKKGEVPDGLTLTADSATDDSDRIVFVKRDDRFVNIFDCGTGELLLDPASDIEFNDARFMFADWDKRNQRYMDKASTEFGPRNYWILTYSAPTRKVRIPGNITREIQTVPDKVYVVNKKGEKLADCPCVEIPVDYSLECISRNGRYCAFKRCRWYGGNSGQQMDETFLMANGKVYPEPFMYVEPDSETNIWNLITNPDENAPYYELNVETGEIETRYP